MGQWWLLCGAAWMAGLVDAVVGGGGLLLTPALFSVYPQAAPASLFGTNKAAAVWGTGMAAWRYGRRVVLPWRSLSPAAVAAFMCSCLGAGAAVHFPPTALRQALPLVLVAVLAYTLWHRTLGQAHAPRLNPSRERLAASAIGATVGFYDGLFGPGAGSFFVFLLVRVLGHDFLHASAGAKLLNTATNLGALLLFGATGHVWWPLAAAMAVANVAGSLLGTRLALRRGPAFVRRVFVVVVVALIARTGHDALVPPLVPPLVHAAAPSTSSPTATPVAAEKGRTTQPTHVELPCPSMPNCAR